MNVKIVENMQLKRGVVGEMLKEVAAGILQKYAQKRQNVHKITSLIAYNIG